MSDWLIKKTVQTIIFVLLYIILFVILLPPLLKMMDQPMGKILYGVMVVGAIGIAVRLRFLFKNWQ